MNSAAISALARRTMVQPTTYRLKMSIITSNEKYTPLTELGNLVISHVKTCRGALATRRGFSCAGWRARRRRSRTCAFARRMRYIVLTEHRYVPSSSRRVKTCGTARSANRSQHNTAATYRRSASLNALRRAIVLSSARSPAGLRRRRNVERLTPSARHVARSGAVAHSSSATSISRPGRRTRGSCTRCSRAPLLFFGCLREAPSARSCVATCVSQCLARGSFS